MPCPFLINIERAFYSKYLLGASKTWAATTARNPRFRQNIHGASKNKIKDIVLFIKKKWNIDHLTPKAQRKFVYN
jgi:hypothetical protein